MKFNQPDPADTTIGGGDCLDVVPDMAGRHLNHNQLAAT